MTVKELLKKQNDKAEYYKKMIDEDTSYERFCAFEGCDKNTIEFSKYCKKHHTLKQRIQSTRKNCGFPNCQQLINTGMFCQRHNHNHRMARIGIKNLKSFCDPILLNKNWDKFILKMDELGRWTNSERKILIGQKLLKKEKKSWK